MWAARPGSPLPCAPPPAAAILAVRGGGGRRLVIAAASGFLFLLLFLFSFLAPLPSFCSSGRLADVEAPAPSSPPRAPEGGGPRPGAGPWLRGPGPAFPPHSFHRPSESGEGPAAPSLQCEGGAGPLGSAKPFQSKPKTRRTVCSTLLPPLSSSFSLSSTFNLARN